MPSAPSPETEPAPRDVRVADSSLTGRRAIRGAALRVISYSIAALLSLVSAPLVFRHLGVAAYGRYATVIAVLGLAAGFTEGGLGPVGVREYTLLAGEERRRFMGDLLGLRLALTAAGGVAATLFVILAGYRSDQVWGAAVGGAGLVIQVTYATLAVSLYARLQVGRQVLTELGSQVFALTLLVVLVLAGAGIVPLLAVPVPAGLLAFLLTARLVRGEIPLRPSFDLTRWRSVLRRTLPVGVVLAAQAVYFRSVLVGVSLIAPAAQTGYFATADRVIEVLLAVPVLLIGTGCPLLARAAEEDLARLTHAVRRTFEMALSLGGGLALCLAAGAPVAMSLIGGGAARPAVSVLRLESVTLLMAFLSTASGFALLAMRHYRQLLVANVIALSITVILTLLLVPAYGARGGAVATSIGEMLVAALSTSMVAATLAHTAPALGHALRVACALLAAGAVAIAPGLGDVVRLGLVGVVFVAALIVLDAVPPELREAFGVQRREQ